MKIIHNPLNTIPVEDFDNLCALDMHELLYSTFGENSTVQFRGDISETVLDSIGFFRLCEYLLSLRLSEKEIKLTKLNNLNTKLVTEIYLEKFTNEKVLELKPRKVYKQEEVKMLDNAMIILDNLLKLTKKRKGKLSLTKKRSDLLRKNNRSELFKIIFKAYAQEFNWYYHDGFSENSGIQSCFGYVLYLLLKNGKKELTTDFYAQKLIKAFPQLLGDFDSSWSTPEEQLKNCLSVRCFERFLVWFGLIEIRNDYSISSSMTYIKNSGLENIFRIDPSQFKFKSSGFQA